MVVINHTNAQNLTLVKVAGIALLTLVAGSASAQIDNSVRQPVNYATMQAPAPGASYTDPAFGTSIKRITDALHTANADAGGMLPWIENEYSTAGPFNSDNSKMILVHVSYFGLYDGSGNFLSNLPMEIGASSEPRWSRTDNSTLYYHYTNQLKAYNVTTAVTTVIHTFSEYASISGNGEMDMSFDGDHLTYTGDGRYVFLYTISTDTKSATFDTNGHAFDSTYVTPDNHVTITWDQAGINARYTGIEMFDSNMNFMSQVAHAGGHMHMSRDLNHDEVLIWTNSNDAQPACGQNAIVKIHLADGVQTCLLSLDWSLAVHISAADSTWAFVETYNPTNIVPPSGWVAYTDELLQIKLDGSQVIRLAQHRSRPLNSYNYMPKLSVSRDGTRLAYASNFDLQVLSGAPQQYGDEYLMTVPTPTAATTPGTATPGATVVNAASYQAAVAPGSMVSIFGTGLANGTESATGSPIATTLQNVVISFNGTPAPLYYVSPKQINAQVPYGLAAGAATMQVTISGSTVSTQEVTISAAAPGIFTTNQTGAGSGSILSSNNYQVVSQSAPTHVGAYISIYCTGLGAVNGAIVEGNPAPNPALNTVIVPQVSVGGISATVTFSGLAPGFAGLYQVNVQVPVGVTAGIAVPVVLTSNGLSSNTATIVIQ